MTTKARTSISFLLLLILGVINVFGDEIADFALDRESYMAGAALNATIAIKKLKPPLKLNIEGGVWCDSLPEGVNCDDLKKQLPSKSQTWTISQTKQLNPPDRSFNWLFPKTVPSDIPLVIQATITKPGSNDPIFTKSIFTSVVQTRSSD